MEGLRRRGWQALGGDDLGGPGSQGVEHRVEHLRILASAARGHVEGMVGIGYRLSASPARRAAWMIGRSKSRWASSSRVPCRNSIGHVHLGRRCCARARRQGLPAGCSGKPRSTSPRTAGRGRCGLRLRCHAAAEGLAAGKQRQAGQSLRSPRATAARTVACASAGASGRFDPRSMYGNW